MCCQKQGTVSPGKSRNGKTVGNGGSLKRSGSEKNVVGKKKWFRLKNSYCWKNKSNIRKMQVNIYIYIYVYYVPGHVIVTSDQEYVVYAGYIQ